jgi:hypothetical protein
MNRFACTTLIKRSKDDGSTPPLYNYSPLDITIVGNGVDGISTDYKSRIAEDKYVELDIKLQYIIALDHRNLPEGLRAVYYGAPGPPWKNFSDDGLKEMFRRQGSNFFRRFCIGLQWLSSSRLILGLGI